MTPSKTADIVALAHQAITHPNTAIGPEIDVSTLFAVRLFLYHASVEATANTNPGDFHVQIAGASAGSEDWATQHKFAASIPAAATEAMTATEPVGEVVLACASTTGFLPLDIIYIQDTTTLADSEWAHCDKVVANVSVDLIDGLTTQKDSADVLWSGAEIFIFDVDVSTATRLRVLFRHEGSVGANCHVKGLAIRLDSIS